MSKINAIKIKNETTDIDLYFLSTDEDALLNNRDLIDKLLYAPNYGYFLKAQRELELVGIEYKTYILSDPPAMNILYEDTVRL